VNDVFLFAFWDGKVKTEKLPSLPVALTSPGAASIDGRIYLAGGIDSTGATPLLISLDMNNLQKGWEKLPQLPVALSHSVVVSQNDGTEECIYIIGGRNKTIDVHTFFSTVWKFKPSKAEWTLEGDIMMDGKPLALSAGTGIAIGKDQILLFGGDPGIFFNLTERLNNAIAMAGDSVKKQLLAGKDSMLTHHPGFSKAVLVYDTITKTWKKTGEIEAESPATSLAFYWDKTVIIPSGEIRPGVRTPRILAAELK
jgi:N-acetylneuraminate epimerase